VAISVSSGLSVPSGFLVSSSPSSPVDGAWVAAESVTWGSDVDPDEISTDESVEASLELAEASVLEESSV
jgi:hypothetical protein